MASGQTRKGVSNFAELPAEVRATIFERAVRKTLPPRAAHFVKLTRTDVDLDTEKELLRAAGVPDVIPLFSDLALLRRRTIQEYQASLVNVSMSDSAGVAQGAQWAINELASVSRDTAECVNEMVRIFKDSILKDKEVVQASGQDCSFLRMIRPDDLVVLTGPEEQLSRDNGYPFFTINSWWREVILVSNEAELETSDVYDEVSHNCPSMTMICPLLANLNRVAFLYKEELDDWQLESMFFKWNGYAKRIGLNRLSKNFPYLQVVYVLDESIKLKPGKEPAADTVSFVDYQATFYEVDGDETVWDIPKPPRGPTFGCDDIPERCGYRVELLACIPNNPHSD